MGSFGVQYEPSNRLHPESCSRAWVYVRPPMGTCVCERERPITLKYVGVVWFVFYGVPTSPEY